MMNNSCDAVLKSSAKRYCSTIESAPFYETFFKNLQKVTILNEVDPFDFKNSLLSAIKKIGLENELRNDVFHWNRERDFIDHNVSCWVDKEPMDYLRKAQMQWEKRIYKSLNSMCTELGVSLSVFRLASDRDEIQEKWNLLSTHSIELGQYRPVYAPKDFLDVLLNIQNPNHEDFGGVLKHGTGWDFSLISLKVNSLAQLKINYEELITGEPLLATLSNSTAFYSKLEDERIAFGQAVLNFNQAPVTQKFLKRLAPHCIREKLWSQVLGIEILPWHKEYFKTLKQFVIQYDMLVDKLIFKDVQLTVCNDDQYFVFEDLLYQVMLCFSRDNAVTNVFRCNSSNPTIGVLKGRSNVINNCVIYPPSGVIPFHGFSMYAAPLCYVFNDPVQLYFAFRSLYMRYWFRLHEVNSHQQGMLSLCVLFQELLEFYEPKLCTHFVSIKVQPIKLVFKWLMRCFSGHLPPEQLLYLWDLILGYDSLEAIPLLAVAILSFRRDSLLEVDTLQNVEAVLADLSSVRVIPLLQFALISG